MYDDGWGGCLRMLFGGELHWHARNRYVSARLLRGGGRLRSANASDRGLRDVFAPDPPVSRYRRDGVYRGVPATRYQHVIRYPAHARHSLGRDAPSAAIYEW